MRKKMCIAFAVRTSAIRQHSAMENKSFNGLIRFRRSDGVRARFPRYSS